MPFASNQPKGNIPQNFIETLLARSDIVQVINQRVPLKKAGGSYKACCPFHNEKTPSFNVSAQKQFYHCFGCGAHGDAINFLKEYDGLSFVEAVESLAAMQGLEVPREQLTPKQAAQQKKAQSLYDVMYLVTKYYRSQLKVHPQSEVAKQYLKHRGLTSEIAKQFVIGFAPSSSQNMQDLLKHGVSQAQLIEAGVLAHSDDQRVYERFRNRLMFPIRDGRGRVIAFGGRILDDAMPKYLNSPETPIFHKSNTLYGLYEMRQARIRPQRMLVVEGYMDVVALAQFDIRNAVATLGTAITEQHMQVLFREVDEVVFCFDGDNAGKKAAWKALELVLPNLQGLMSVKFLFLPEGEDPDSMVREEGKANFEKRVDQALGLTEFLFKGLVAQMGAPLSSVEGQQKLISLVKPYVEKAPGAMPDLIVNALADLIPIQPWRIGQIMGVRVGSNKKAQVKKNAPQIETVTSGVLKLMRVLYLRPNWAATFTNDLLDAMQSVSHAEYAFLAQFVQVLKLNQYLIDAAEDWLVQSNNSQIVQQIKAMPLPDDDGFLVAEFEGLLLDMVNRVKQLKIKQSGSDVEAFAELIKQQKS